jgi:hypothetical protein
MRNTIPSNSVYKPYKGRTIEPWVGVRVHRNLTRGGYSIIAAEGTYKNLVVAHADTVCINGSFEVNEKGRDRVRATGKKEVHAWVDGFLVWGSGNRAGTLLNPEDVDRWWHDTLYFKATYNPFKNDYFVDKETGEQIAPIGEWHILLSPEGVKYGINGGPEHATMWRRTYNMWWSRSV